MRVLFVSAPLLGHVFPVVPLARAVRAAGHEVLVATAAEALRVRAAGLPVADIGPGFRFDRIARRVMLRHPLIARAELAGTAGTRGVGLLFGTVNEEIVDPVGTVADRFRPDLIVYEPLAVAGAVAAARRDIPAIRQENNLFDGAVLVDATAQPALRRHRVDGLPEPAAVLQIAPPALVGERTGWPMRHVPYSGGGDLPGWLAERPARPRIAVSRSTVAGPGSGGVMGAVVAVAERVDAEIVLVRPEPRLARRLPANVRAVDWVPLDLLLTTCAGLVHHGGAGTVLGALVAGVPQLVVPGPGDRRHNASIVQRAGVGLAVPARAIGADTLHRLCLEPGLLAGARAVQAQIAARPDPSAVAARLLAR
ncbi:MAG TPA: nucleotide disphospho-sugar-binding domain-containing protein [Catenuloplanes sp.]